MPRETLVRIGNGNYVIASKIVAILNPASSPMRRLREDAKNESRLIDATQGKKTRTILVLDSNHVILSSVGSDTISQRVLQAQLDTNVEQNYLVESDENEE